MANIEWWANQEKRREEWNECDIFVLTEDVDEENFGLIRPSLIRQLRAILDQYPDDGQILKVSKY